MNKIRGIQIEMGSQTVQSTEDAGWLTAAVNDVNRLELFVEEGFGEKDSEFEVFVCQTGYAVRNSLSYVASCMFNGRFVHVYVDDQ